MMELHDWFMIAKNGLGRNAVTLLGLLLVSSRGAPGPWHRRHLIPKLVVLGEASGLNPQTHEQSLHELRDLGYVIAGPRSGEWITTDRAFDWIDEHFPEHPSGERPRTKRDLNGHADGMVFGTDYELHYVHGRIAEVRLLGERFRCSKDAVVALKRRGIWTDGHWRNWRAPELLEGHIWSVSW